jgi:hypothetical protein
MLPYFLNGCQSFLRKYKGHKNLFLAHKYKFDSGAAGPQVGRPRAALHPATTGRN